MQFWVWYFANRFLLLEHQDASWSGQALIDISQNGPAALLKEPRSQFLRISDEALRAYHYNRDKRFTLIAAAPLTVAAAFDAVVERTYP